MRRPRGNRHLLAIALLLLGVGCTTVPPAPQTAAQLQRAATMTLTGLLTAPATLLSDKGLGIIGNNGSSLVSKIKYRVRATAAWAPVAGAAVTLEDAHGHVLAGATATTDAQGHFTVANVPAGQAWVVRATAGPAAFSTLVPDQGTAPDVALNPATTAVTESLRDSLKQAPGALSAVPAAQFQALSQLVETALQQDDVAIAELAKASDALALFEAAQAKNAAIAKFERQLVAKALASVGAPSPSPSVATATVVPPSVPVLPSDGPPSPPAPIARPEIMAFSPAKDSPGTIVTLKGSGFSATSASDTVTFGLGTASVVAATATTLTVKVPAGATAGPIQVTVDGRTGQTATNFSVVSAGTILGTYTLGGGTWPASLALDPAGDVWVACANSNSVSELGPDGSLIGSYPVGGYPCSIAIDASGDPWVANARSNSVMKLSSRGAVLGAYPLSDPRALAFDASKRAWVAQQASNTVSVLAPDGTAVGTFATSQSPQAVAIDAAGDAWIANSLSNTVTKLSPTGTKLGEYPAGEFPSTLAFDEAGDLWVGNFDVGTLTKLAPDGSKLGSYPAGTMVGGIAIAPNGNLWVAVDATKDIGEYALEGTALGQYFVDGDAHEALAFDPAGNLWLTSSSHNTVTELAP